MGFCDSSELLRAGITFTSRRSRRPWPAPSRRRVRQCGGEEELRLDKTRGNGTSTAQEVHEISRRRSSRGRVPLLKSDMQNANEKEPYELPFPSASGPLCASFKLIMLSSHAAYGLRSRRAGEFCRPFPFLSFFLSCSRTAYHRSAQSGPLQALRHRPVPVTHCSSKTETALRTTQQCSTPKLHYQGADV